MSQRYDRLNPARSASPRWLNACSLRTLRIHVPSGDGVGVSRFEPFWHPIGMWTLSRTRRHRAPAYHNHTDFRGLRHLPIQFRQTTRPGIRGVEHHYEQNCSIVMSSCPVYSYTESVGKTRHLAGPARAPSPMLRINRLRQTDSTIQELRIHMARIAVIGLIDFDTILQLDRFPDPGGSANVASIATIAGGATANTAIALARLGESVTLRAVVGNNETGDTAVADLSAHGVDCGMVTRSDQPTGLSTILLDGRTGARTTLRHKGAMIRMGDRLDIAALFGHDVVVLDMIDAPLRRFLTDLPAHTRPDVRLLGPIARIVENAEPDAREIAFRFDTIVGTERQFRELLGLDHAGDLVAFIQHHMPGANLRAAVITSEHLGSRWVTRDQTGTSQALAVDTIDTTGAGDAFVAGIAWSMAQRLPWPEATRFANAVAALSTRSPGAQTSLPTMTEVEHLLRS